MHYAFRSVIRLYRLHIRCPTSVLRCYRCLHSGEGTLHRIIKHCALSIAVREGLKGLKGPKGIAQQTSNIAVPLVSVGVFVVSGSEVGQQGVSAGGYWWLGALDEGCGVG